MAAIGAGRGASRFPACRQWAVKRPRLLCLAVDAGPGAAPPAYTPLVDAVAERGRRAHEAPFHVPGHKRGAGTPPALCELVGGALRYDLTELDGLDYLSSPEGPIREAQELAAAAWGAARTFFLVNGTTAGIHAAVLTTCSGPGDALILARNAHLSAFNAAALAGCTPVYAAAVQRGGLAHHVTPAALEDAFVRAERRGLRPRAALVVSPTYFGVLSDVGALAEVCHRRSAALVVDEAHGAHLRFLPGGAGLDGAGPGPGAGPVAALQAGADVAVQSTHKQLSAMTQGAMLHLSGGGRVDGGRVARALQVLQTSSPSYLVMASLDAARAQAQDAAAVAAAHAAAAHIAAFFDAPPPPAGLAHSIRGSGAAHGLRLLTPEVIGGGARRDPWRFTVLVGGLGCSGWEAAAELERRWGVVAELAAHSAVVFAVGIGTTMRHAEQLTAALREFGERHGSAASSEPFSEVSREEVLWQLPGGDEGCGGDAEAALTPREVLQAGSEAVAARDAVGRVAAELLCPYPPGVPALYPGELVTPAALERLRAVLAAGGKVVGAEDPTLLTLRVVPRSETPSGTPPRGGGSLA